MGIGRSEPGLISSVNSYKLNVLLLLWVIVSFLLVLIKNSYDFPFWDDYNQNLEFLNNYITTTSLHEKLHLLIMQHNEHRIVFTRVMALLILKVFGRLDFRYLLYIASFVQLLSVLVLIKVNNGVKLSKLAMMLFFLPLLFNLFDYDNFFWVPASVQQLGQIFCSLIVLYFFIKYLKTDKLTCLLFSILSSVVNSFVGGGFLALYIAIVIYLFMRKRYKVATVFFACFILNSYLNFHVLSYVFIAHPKSAIINYTICFFTFIGALVTYSNMLSLVAGVVIFIVSLFIILNKRINNDFIKIFLLFFLITASMVCVGRASSVYANTSRYSIYSLIATGLIILELYNKKTISQCLSKAIIYLPFIYYGISLIYIYYSGVLNIHFGQIAKIGQLNYPLGSLVEAQRIYSDSRKFGVYDSKSINTWLDKNQLTIALSESQPEGHYQLEYHGDDLAVSGIDSSTTSLIGIKGQRLMFDYGIQVDTGVTVTQPTCFKLMSENNDKTYSQIWYNCITSNIDHKIHNAHHAKIVIPNGMSVLKFIVLPPSGSKSKNEAITAYWSNLRIES